MAARGLLSPSESYAGSVCVFAGDDVSIVSGADGGQRHFSIVNQSGTKVLALRVESCVFRTCVRYSTIWEVNAKCFKQLLTDGAHERLCTCTCIFSTELLSCLMQKINAKYCSQFLRMFSLFTRHEAFVIGKPRRTCDDIC